MTEPEVFVLADHAMQKTVEQIRDDQWEMEMPKEFLRKGQEKVTLREIINYHAYDDAWVPDMLTGKTMEETGVEKFKGNLLDDDPKRNFAAIVQKACDAAVSFTDLDMIVHCSFGDYKAREYFWQINMFRALRAHDIAKVIGVDPTLSDELVQGVWDEVSPHAEEWRTYGVFGPEIKVPADASPMDKLLGLTGRSPDTVA